MTDGGGARWLTSSIGFGSIGTVRATRGRTTWPLQSNVKKPSSYTLNQPPAPCAALQRTHPANDHPPASHSSSGRNLDFCLLVLSAVGWWCGKVRLFGLLIQADPGPLLCVWACAHTHTSREHSPMTTTSTIQRQCRQKTHTTRGVHTHINAPIHTHAHTRAHK